MIIPNIIICVVIFQIENEEEKENIFSAFLQYCCDKCDFRVTTELLPEFKLHLDMNHNETNGNQHFDLVKTEQNQGNLLKGIDKKTGM